MRGARALDAGRARGGAPRERLSTSCRPPSRATSHELGLVKVRAPSGRLVYAPPGTTDLDRLARDLAAAMRRYAMSVEPTGNLVVVTTPSGYANALAQAIDEAGHPAIAGTIAGDNTIFVAAREGTLAAQALRDELTGTILEGSGVVMPSTAVVAYSRRARHELHRRLAEGGLYGFDEVVAVLVDVGQEFDLEESIARGERGRRRRRPARRPQGRVRRRAVRTRDQGERALRGQVPARLGALAARDRAGGRRDRARPRRRGGRARLHRQGQRPAPLRARVQGALPGRHA